MAEPPIPKLTDDEATVLRRRLMGHARNRLASAGLRCHGIRQSPNYTDLGLAALAAYDAEQRRAIRVEAMREVHDMIRTTRNAHVDRHLRGIEVMIAKEEA